MGWEDGTSRLVGFHLRLCSLSSLSFHLQFRATGVEKRVGCQEMKEWRFLAESSAWRMEICESCRAEFCCSAPGLGAGVLFLCSAPVPTMPALFCLAWTAALSTEDALILLQALIPVSCLMIPSSLNNLAFSVSLGMQSRVWECSRTGMLILQG